MFLNNVLQCLKKGITDVWAQHHKVYCLNNVFDKVLQCLTTTIFDVWAQHNNDFEQCFTMFNILTITKTDVWAQDNNI